MLSNDPQSDPSDSSDTSITIDPAIKQTAAPEDTQIERLDVRNMGPPKPLTETIEALPHLDGVLVQINDRAPQHLYPKLEERGFAFESIETEEATLTAIWKA